MLLRDFGCIVCGCDMIDPQSRKNQQGGRCPLGHTLCAECTAQYVERTLVGTVWWDRIKCADPGCTEYMRGMSVRRSINHRLVKRIDAAQLQVVPLVGPEAKLERECAAEAAAMARSEEDHASGATVANTTKPCPNCDAPSELKKGCKHVDCDVCKHAYCFTCGCDWVRGHLSVPCIPR